MTPDILHNGDVTLYLGDCLDVMKEIPDGSVDLVLVDPPYGHNNNNDGDLKARWEKALGRPSEDEAPRPILNDGVEANDIYQAGAIWSF